MGKGGSALVGSQENSRFKRRGIRSMNILDMLDAIVDLTYEIVTEMLNDARRRITLHGRDALTVFAQKHIDANSDAAKSFTIWRGLADAQESGPFIIHLASDPTGQAGREVVAYDKDGASNVLGGPRCGWYEGCWTCTERDKWMVRFGGLPCKHMWCKLHAHRDLTIS